MVDIFMLPLYHNFAGCQGIRGTISRNTSSPKSLVVLDLWFWHKNCRARLPFWQVEWRRCRDSNPVPHKVPLGAFSYVDTSTPPKGGREPSRTSQHLALFLRLPLPPSVKRTPVWANRVATPAKATALALPYGQRYCPHDAHLPNAGAKHGEETCKPPERDLSRLG